jgi:2',3'-cyclic-nucleotide 2'-phosphodiesterase (5'-nucleotidase family)
MSPITLQILHAADQEAGLPAIQDAVNFSAVIEGLADDFDNTLRLSSGDIYIPGPFFNASSDVYGAPGIGDILVNNALGFQAVAFGNHEFDQGTGVISTLLRPDTATTGPGIGANGYEGTAFPYLSSNLDFSTDANLADLVVPGGNAPQPNTIADSVVLEVGGEQIGIVGATTPLLPSISSPGDVGVFPADPNDIAALAAEIQASVDALTANGINKIVLLAHFQQISIEQEVAALLDDVDIVIAGGSNTLLANPDDPLRDGDVSEGPYPIEVDSDGETVYVINTDGNYRYVGRLAASFDENGVITEILDESGAFATDDAGVDRVYGQDVDARDVANPTIVEVTDAIADVVLERDGNTFGSTSVFLNGTRGDVRTQETNLGNLTADANLFAAKEYDDTVTVSIKNGGGIRDNIGQAIVPAGGTGGLELSPPPANPLAGKEEGEVSQLDIENSLRFNNELSLLTVTAEELEYLIEHGVAATAPGATPGQFPQVGGISFSFDANQQAIAFDDMGNVTTDGDRVRSLAILNDDGSIADVIVEDGELQGDPNREIRLVTLNFLAGGGDGYPFDVFGENRVDLVTQPLPSGASNVATFAADGSEQDALAEYLAANFSNMPFGLEDVGPADDSRIQNLAFRDDTVLGGSGSGETPEFEDELMGGDGNDVLRGDAIRSQDGGDDLIEGGAGDDKLSGFGGDDQILGGAGDDELSGGAGDDLLDGGTGNDVVYGGSGADTFVIGVREGIDVIRDFELGTDLIGLEGGLTFGDLTVTQNRNDTLISVGDDTLARVVGVTPTEWAASDFVAA